MNFAGAELSSLRKRGAELEVWILILYLLFRFSVNLNLLFL